MRRIYLSMGAGVQTTAMLLKYTERYHDGGIVFADTGDEHKETYDYIRDYLEPYCESNGMSFDIARMAKYEKLYDYLWARKTLPIVQTRECTRVSKIYPINHYLRAKGHTKKNPAILDIGFSYDEVHRVGNLKRYCPKYIVKECPLLYDRITRRDCEKIITDHGWPIPPKSSCDYCPFRGIKRLRALSVSDPDRFADIVRLEKNDRKGLPLLGRGRPFLTHITGNQKLDDFVDDEYCDSGHCFR